MPLQSDLTLDAAKFASSAISKQTAAYNDKLIKVQQGIAKWWEASCKRCPLMTNDGVNIFGWTGSHSNLSHLVITSKYQPTTLYLQVTCPIDLLLSHLDIDTHSNRCFAAGRPSQISPNALERRNTVPSSHSPAITFPPNADQSSPAFLNPSSSRTARTSPSQAVTVDAQSHADSSHPKKGTPRASSCTSTAAAGFCSPRLTRYIVPALLSRPLSFRATALTSARADV